MIIIIKLYKRLRLESNRCAPSIRSSVRDCTKCVCVCGEPIHLPAIIVIYSLYCMCGNRVCAQFLKCLAFNFDLEWAPLEIRSQWWTLRAHNSSCIDRHSANKCLRRPYKCILMNNNNKIMKERALPIESNDYSTYAITCYRPSLQPSPPPSRTVPILVDMRHRLCDRMPTTRMKCHNGLFR